MESMTDLQARDRLLAAAVDHALDAGIADLSLRELAAAIGTSHRMLLYHFGSREGLLVAVANAVEDRERALALEAGTSEADARRFFRRVTDPKFGPQERLFFELYSHALLGRPGTEAFLDRVVESWIAPIAERLIAGGADKRDARAEARLQVAVVRGLILDLLATGDRKGVTAAFDRFLDLIAAADDPVAKS
jgi:AcrR family transcriptional regulator